MAPVGLRARAAFQQSMAHGRSVCEWEPSSAASQEIQRLWDHLETLAPSGQSDLYLRAN
jgi:chromosome partitioning protein